MDDHDALRFPFVITEILSPTAPLASLDDLLATKGVTLSCLIGSNGHDRYWCAQLRHPIKYRIGHTADPRLDPAYMGVDEQGAFTWIHYVALRPHDETFGPGVRGTVADVALVVDASLGSSRVFDSRKVDWVATALIDSSGPNPPMAPRPSRAEMAEPGPSITGPAARSASSPPSQPPARSIDEFGLAVDGVIATLAGLTGTPVSDVVRPPEVKARRHSHYGGAEPSYSFHGNEIRYRTSDPVQGPLWRSTTDVDEALYWISDDLACAMAWSWARRTPSAGAMNSFEVRWLLAVPLWQTLMTALDPRWAVRTQRRIAEISREAQHRGATPPTLG